MSPAFCPLLVRETAFLELNTTSFGKIQNSFSNNICIVSHKKNPVSDNVSHGSAWRVLTNYLKPEFKKLKKKAEK